MVKLDFGSIQQDINLEDYKNVPFFEPFTSGRWNVSDSIDLKNINFHSFQVLTEFIKGHISDIPIECIKDFEYFGIDTLLDFDNKEITTKIIDKKNAIISEYLLHNFEWGYHGTSKKFNGYIDQTRIIEDLIIEIPPIHNLVWVNNLGLHLFKNIEYYIGGKYIFKYNSKLLENYFNVFLDESEKQFNTFNIPYSERKEKSKKGFTLKISLKSFNIPMINFAYYEEIFKVELNDMHDLVEEQQEINEYNIKQYFKKNNIKRFIEDNISFTSILNNNNDILIKSIEHIFFETIPKSGFRCSIDFWFNRQMKGIYFFCKQRKIVNIEFILDKKTICNIPNIMSNELIPQRCFGKKLPFGYHYISLQSLKNLPNTGSGKLMVTIEHKELESELYYFWEKYNLIRLDETENVEIYYNNFK